MRLVRMKEGCPIYLSTNVYFFSSLLQVLAVALAYFVVAASADCGLLGKWRNVNEYYENTTLVTYETNREFASTMTETVKVTAGALCTSNTLSAVFNYQNYQSDFSMIQYQRTSCSVDVAGCGTCAQPTTGAETYTFSSNCNKVTFEVNGKRTTYDNTYRPPTPPPTTPVPTTAAPTTAAPTTPVPTTAAPTNPPTNPPPTATPTSAAPPSGGACDHIGTWDITEVVDAGSGMGYAFEFAMVRTYTATTIEDAVAVSMSPAGNCETNTITSSYTYKLTADGIYTYTTVSCRVDKAGCGSCADDDEGDGTVEFFVSSACNMLTLVEDGEAMVLHLVWRPESISSNDGLVTGLIVGLVLAILVAVAVSIAFFLYWRKTNAAKVAHFAELNEPLAANGSM